MITGSINTNIALMDKLIDSNKALNISGTRLPNNKQLTMMMTSLIGKLKRIFLYFVNVVTFVFNVL